MSIDYRRKAQGEMRQRTGRNRTLSDSLPDLDAKVVALQDKLRKAQEIANDVRRKYEYNARAIADMDQAITDLNEVDRLRSEGETDRADEVETDARYRISLYTGKNSIITSNHMRDGYSSY